MVTLRAVTAWVKNLMVVHAHTTFNILLPLTALGLIHINQPARVTQKKSILNNFLTQPTNSKAIDCRCLLTEGSTVKLNYSNVQKILTALVFF
jgi:hypothetical protein